jgi:hypothetical protein
MTQDVLYEREKKEMARDALYAYIDLSLDGLVAFCVQSQSASILLFNKKDVIGLIREVLEKEFIKYL